LIDSSFRFRSGMKSFDSFDGLFLRESRPGSSLAMIKHYSHSSAFLFWRDDIARPTSTPIKQKKFDADYLGTYFSRSFIKGSKR
jgi:hypothetical protein